MSSNDAFDLEAAVKTLAGQFGEIDAIYLFGSRRWGTGSSRSDIDVIIVPNTNIKPAAIRDYVLRTNTALDIFILSNGRATSAANESYISGESNEDVLEKLHAVLLYERSRGSTAELEELKALELDRHVSHKLTALPNNSEALEVNALRKIFERAGEHGLPTKPYLGQSTDEASKFITTVIRALPGVGRTVTGHGNAKSGWTASLKNEYDFQNLFWIVTKPWLPALTREQCAIIFDGNKKQSDFSLFGSQLIIELKHIKDDNTKRSIVKTLKGLGDFYKQHPNVRSLIFGILVEESVDLDHALWESEYSHTHNAQSVFTVVVRNPSA